MRKIYIFALTLAIVAVSCQKDVHQEVMHQDVVCVSNDDNGYAVSVDEALANLDRELDFIYGASTRSGDRPNVRKVHTLHRNAVANATRSGEVNAEELLYIVEFDEGQGSAILGADKRVEKVFAVLDETVLTEDDFIGDAIVGGEDNEEKQLKRFLVSQIVGSAEYQLSTSSLDISPVVDGIVYSKFDTIVTKYLCVDPLLRTKWDQGYPYNISHSDGEVMGCVPVAIAQFLYYHKWPASGELYEQVFDWDLMAETEYDNPYGVSYDAYEEVSDFMLTIGNEIGAYTSGVNISSLRTVLSHLGVESSYVSFDLEDAKEIMRTRRPFCMRAVNQNSNKGHSWVVDGWKSYRKIIIENMYNKFGTLVNTRTVTDVSEHKMHCNFGWAGYCDGYYAYEVLCFDTRVPLPYKDVDEDFGDIRYGNGDYNEYYLNSTFKMVKY